MAGGPEKPLRDEAVTVHPPGSSGSAKWFWLGAVLVTVVFLGLLESELWRPEVILDGRHNVQIAEAQAWREGRLDLPMRLWDTAEKDGKVYSHFPILFTMIGTVLLPLCHGVPHWFLLFFMALPVALLAYVLFCRITGSALHGALLAIALVCGTSIWPVVNQSLKGGGAYYPNHVLGVVGILILLVEFHGRQRVAVAGVGLIIATLARQLTAAFAIPLIWLAVREQPPTQRRRQLIALVVVGAIVAGVPLVVNTLKFGNPLETGYMLIYEGRHDDTFARDAHQYGLFSAHFVPRNAYYLNLGFPKFYRIVMAGRPEYHVRHNEIGTGIWWTAPLLLWLFVDLRKIVRDPARRSLLAAALVVFAALLFFHTTGQTQRGYNRFSLDFLPALMVLVAPTCFVGRRRWLTLAFVAWSVIYFRWLV